MERVILYQHLISSGGKKTWNMYCSLCGALSSLCILLLLGADAEDCIKTILNRRETYKVVSGESLSMSCIVQHCGDQYTGKWIWKNSTHDTLDSVSRTSHHSLANASLSANKTRLILDLERVSEMDEGSYGCSVEWSSGEVSRGHLMYVNVTAAVSVDRKVPHGILICFGVALCVAVILGLAFYLRSKMKFAPVASPRPMPRPAAEYQVPLHQSTPRPPPRRNAPQKNSTSSEKAPHQPKQKTEVVYADISQDVLWQQQRVKPSKQPSIVYSSVRFA
uniref:Ig-like domain-containing protein n=1 Tax=Neogobius melanostomus TaxID=47308 RepID=A0A8C6TAV6_9GOBI